MTKVSADVDAGAGTGPRPETVRAVLLNANAEEREMLYERLGLAYGQEVVDGLREVMRREIAAKAEVLPHTPSASGSWDRDFSKLNARDRVERDRIAALMSAAKAAAVVRDTEVAAAVEVSKLPAVAEPASMMAPWIDPDAAQEVDWNRGGKSLHNAKVTIARLGIRCQFDDFHKKYMVHGHPCMKGGSVSESLDNMALMVRNEISKTFKLDVSKGLVMETLQIKCMERAFDPVKDYLDGLEWTVYVGWIGGSLTTVALKTPSMFALWAAKCWWPEFAECGSPDANSTI
jgi:hypothetical protein